MKIEWRDAMGEISGFGGDYEKQCHKMLFRGLAWLDAHPGVVLYAEDQRSVMSTQLEEHVGAIEGGCSDAMLSIVLSHLAFIHAHGWPEFMRQMALRQETEARRVYAKCPKCGQPKVEILQGRFAKHGEPISKVELNQFLEDARRNGAAVKMPVICLMSDQAHRWE